MIHCDAGPSVVRAYPVTKDGAGYKATIVNILDGSKKNNWFRPADVCVAPDGSLFVTDWYDPGVGGHAQRDIDRGRIFRVAPPGTRVLGAEVRLHDRRRGDRGAEEPEPGGALPGVDGTARDGGEGGAGAVEGLEV